jgi:hypothetical protein
MSSWRKGSPVTDPQIAYAMIAESLASDPPTARLTFTGVRNYGDLEITGGFPAGRTFRHGGLRLYVGLHGSGEEPHQLELHAISPSGLRRHVATAGVAFAPGASRAWVDLPVETTLGDWGMYGMELSIDGRVLTIVPFQVELR